MQGGQSMIPDPNITEKINPYEKFVYESTLTFIKMLVTPGFRSEDYQLCHDQCRRAIVYFTDKRIKELSEKNE